VGLARQSWGCGGVGSLGSQRREDRRSEELGPQHLWPDAADRTSGLRSSARTVDGGELIGGQYRLLGPLGDSSYGRAMRAEQVSSGREVALHMIPEGSVSERVLVRELPLVVAKCALLSHPNVVALHGFGRVHGDAGPFYLVTDALEGVSLAEYLDAEGEPDLSLALTLVRQIGRALRAAHKLGIVHGDLRPANVRVIATEDGLHVRVTGFGKMPMLRLEDEPTTFVRGLSAPTYAAPELLRGEPIDARCDVYSLGTILFRMVAGQTPFGGATPSAVLEAHKRAAVPSLRAVAGDRVSPELDALVARSLAKSRTERFPDVVAMMSAMRFLAVKQGDTLAREVSEVSSLSALGHTRVNSILPSVALPELTHEPLTLDPDRQRRSELLSLALGVVLGLLVAAAGWFVLSR